MRKEDYGPGAMDAEFEIPHELALKLMEFHGGQWSPLYSIASRAIAGEKVDRHHIEDAIGELDDFKNPNDEDAEGEAVALMTILQGILDGEDMSEEIALVTEIDVEPEDDFEDDDFEDEDFEDEDDEDE